MTPSLRPLTRRVALGVVLLAVASCRDAPTTPGTLQQLAGGEEWVAVRVPERVPTLDTWMPYLRPVTAQHRAALRQVEALQAQAETARRSGQPARARAYGWEAVRAAVVSLNRKPEARVLRESLSAVALWGERVEREVDLNRYPALRTSVASVAEDHRRAGEALAAGDTIAGVLYIASAATTIHDHAPSAVALRVLSRVEQRLRTEQETGADHTRALHLLSSAREELLRGDPARALQRAFYALQLADGKGLRSPAPDSAGACMPFPC